MPHFDKLAEGLRSHYALRSLLQRSNVKLQSVGRAKRNVNLVYPCFPWENSDAESLHDGDIKVADYPDSHPRLKLFKLPEPVPGDPSSESFEGFLLIGTKDIADYGFTLAGREGRDHARRLAGYVDDVYIQTLLTEYRRSGGSEQNPRPVVSQDRRPRQGGLESNHPYTKALFAALTPIVDEALRGLQSESRAQERSDVSEALQYANEEAGRRLSQMLDAEGEAPAPKPLPEGFYFLPPSRVLKRGGEQWESITLYSIQGEPDTKLAGAEASLHLKDHDICQVESSTVTLRERSGTAPGQIATIKLKGLDKLSHTTLTASVDGITAEARVSVEEVPPQPVLFKFERSRYSVRPSKQRTVRVVIPELLIEDNADAVVALSVRDSKGGVVIRGGDRQDFRDGTFDGNRLAYVVPFKLEGRQVGAKVKLTASFQDQQAEAELVVGGGTLKVVLDDRETSPPDQRAKVYDVRNPCSYPEHDTEICLHIFARHPRVELYLGEPTVSADGIFWDLNDSPGFRAIYADCVADAVTEFQLLNSGTNEELVPGDVLVLFWKTKKQALAAMQRIYIEDETWKSQRKLLNYAG